VLAPAVVVVAAVVVAAAAAALAPVPVVVVVVVALAVGYPSNLRRPVRAPNSGRQRGENYIGTSFSVSPVSTLQTGSLARPDHTLLGAYA
ncbi:uncharacterized protein METZ01_LOCUS68022, partial [marine metagenome]